MSRTETSFQVVAVRVLSVAVAFLLWLSVAVERTGTVRLSVPVVAEHVPKGLALATPPPSRLELKVSGPRLLLYRLDWSAPVCRVDLAAAGSGTVTFRSPENLIGLDRELKVVSVYPDSFAVTLKAQ
jgi:hypothetical protein